VKKWAKRRKQGNNAKEEEGLILKKYGLTMQKCVVIIWEGLGLLL
jgi:hypothetical protein